MNALSPQDDRTADATRRSLAVTWRNDHEHAMYDWAAASSVRPSAVAVLSAATVLIGGSVAVSPGAFDQAASPLFYVLLGVAALAVAALAGLGQARRDRKAEAVRRENEPFLSTSAAGRAYRIAVANAETRGRAESLRAALTPPDPVEALLSAWDTGDRGFHAFLDVQVAMPEHDELLALATLSR